MQEIWHSVVGYEGLHEVSNMGRVKSMGRTTRTGQVFPPRMLVCSIDRGGAGYRFTRLSLDGVVKKVNVHVLVLEAFVGARPTPKHQCCHGDGDRGNARLSNLRWDTPKANSADRMLHGTDGRGERAANAVLDSEMVSWIRDSHQSSLKLAPILGIASSTIRAVRIGQNWSHL